MANKLFSFSKQEVYFLKKTLPSCKLNAYQIPLFQSILESLDTPVIQGVLESFDNPVIPKLKEEHLLTPHPPVVFPNINQGSEQVTISPSPTPEPVVDGSSYFQSPGVQTPIPPQTPEQDPCPTPQFISPMPPPAVEEPIPVPIINPETIPIQEPVPVQPQPVIEEEPKNIFEVIDKRT